MFSIYWSCWEVGGKSERSDRIRMREGGLKTCGVYRQERYKQKNEQSHLELNVLFSDFLLKGRDE